MTPREFLETVVRPNVEEFHTHYTDLRRAYNAVSSVDALAANIYLWARVNAPSAVVSILNDSQYRKELAIRSPDFDLLRDVAKAQKHARLTDGNPQITLAAQVVARPIGYGEGPYGLGRYGGVQQVVVDIAPGNFSYLESTIDSALAVLEAEMAALGCA
jgi:hypothetical protein